MAIQSEILTQLISKEQDSVRRYNFKQYNFNKEKKRLSNRYVFALVKLRQLEYKKPQIQGQEYNKSRIDSFHRSSLVLQQDSDSEDQPQSPLSEISIRQDKVSEDQSIDEEETIEQKKQREAEELIGTDFPELVQQYVEGKLTRAQLKQRYFSKTHSFKYTCFDDIAQELGLEVTDPEISRLKIQKAERFNRRYWRSYRQANPEHREKPAKDHSLAFKYFSPATINKKSSSIPIAPATTTNSTKQTFFPESKSTVTKRNKSFVVPTKVKSLQQPSYLSQSQGNHKPIMNVKYGGKLSARGMHSYLVESIKPVSTRADDGSTDRSVQIAANRAKKRIKQYNRRPAYHSRPVSMHLIKRPSAIPIPDSFNIPDYLQNCLSLQFLWHSQVHLQYEPRPSVQQQP